MRLSLKDSYVSQFRSMLEELTKDKCSVDEILESIPTAEYFSSDAEFNEYIDEIVSAIEMSIQEFLEVFGQEYEEEIRGNPSIKSLGDLAKQIKESKKQIETEPIISEEKNHIILLANIKKDCEGIKILCYIEKGDKNEKGRRFLLRNEKNYFRRLNYAWY